MVGGCSAHNGMVYVRGNKKMIMKDGHHLD